VNATLAEARGTRLARVPTERDGSPEKTGDAVEGSKGGAGRSQRKRKITISLSEKSLRALEELRIVTDADTDSEVFRNALRLHLTLLRAHAAGVKLLMKRDGAEEAIPVTLFTESE
jgi:Ribbon-helix-helix protein, copG family